MKITDIRCHVMSIPNPDGTGVRRNWIFVEVYGITIAPHNPYGPVALAAAAHFSAAIQNFNILEHCPIQTWFDDVQTVKVPVVKGHVDLEELGSRPGLGVGLDMDLVKSRSHIAMQGIRYLNADGSSGMY
jgi:galactonate dehydratase